MVGSAAITFGVALVSGIVCFFGLLLALNGFMGQERAVNASIITYIVLAILVVLTVTVMSTLTANFLQRRLDWTATGRRDNFRARPCRDRCCDAHSVHPHRRDSRRPDANRAINISV